MHTRDLLAAPEADRRHAADVVSWGIVGTLLAAPAITAMAEWNFTDTTHQHNSLWSGLSVAIPYATTAVIGFTAKYLIARERPYATQLRLGSFDGVVGRCHLRNPPAECQGDRNASFPSLHSALGFVGATIGCAYSSLWGCAFYGAGASSGATLRIIADKHYLSDVIVGSLLGITVAVVSAALLPNPQQNGPYMQDPAREIVARGVSMGAGTFLGVLGTVALSRW
jgi:membrane-associated phospholipid phosphatase